MSLTAEQAKQISINNNKRKKEIKNLIETAEQGIKSACKKGRRHSTLYAGFIDGGNPEYPEIIDHFKKLGYKLELCYGTNVYDIRW